MSSEMFKQFEARGLSSPYATDFMAYNEVNGKIVVDYAKTEQMLAMDAAPVTITTGNVGVPGALVTLFDPTITQILFAAMNASKLAPEARKGDWTDRYMNFTVTEYTGDVTPYGDFAENVTSDVNFESPARENYLFQTVVRFGDLEQAVAARQRLALASEKQRAAATILNKAHNKFALYGVAGKKTYGLLNDPNLPSTASPATVTIGGTNYSTWADKIDHGAGAGANYVFNDVLKLYNALASANGGNIDTSSRIILAVSNARVGALSSPNTYGITAMKMIKDNFPNMEIVQLPELSTGSGEWAYMIVPELFGESTADIAYSEKMRMGRLVPELSSFKQKAVGGTWGAVIRRPSLIKIMTGI